MDKAELCSYLSVMLRVLMIFVTVFSFAVASFAALAHEADMAAPKAHGAQMQHEQHIQDTASSKASCAEDKACKAEGGLCDLACAGIPVFPPPDRAAASAADLRERYLRHLDAALVATAPGLNERPPKLRLL